MITKFIDWFVSHLPSPLLMLAIRLLQPGLYQRLQFLKGITREGNTSVFTFKQGHIVVTDGEIKPM